MKPVVAVDGYASSGKGTIARMLAQKFNFAYLDSGILYRMFAYLQLESLRGSENFENLQNINENLKNGTLWEISVHDLLAMKNKISENVLRSDTVSNATISTSKLSAVRNVITKFIREFAADPGKNFAGSVIDGRDIGTVAIPNATCKIFMTADPKIRAKRRFDELKTKNCNVTFEEVYENMKNRDLQDSTRDTAPLTFNDDYIIVDTSNETVEESFEKIVRIINDYVIKQR
ncbi:MAG: (d)CMP kinase [Holosporaceae bacterium]|jgi:cytidylate kinase|nr:(d)CMP kinase [Holosporaceae bacterium]